MSVDPIAAEAKAVEQGAHAFLKPDGSFVVRSASRPNLRHRVTCEAVSRDASRFVVRMLCSCESSRARPSAAIACWHGALVGRRLEREGWARWQEGAWWLTEEGLRRVRSGGLAQRPPEPSGVRMSGRCPVCRSYVSVIVPDGAEPREVASRHRDECGKEFADRLAKVRATNIERDLWER